MNEWLDWIEGRSSDISEDEDTPDDCPNCGENRNGWLQWDDAEQVLWCLTCGTPFAPGENRQALLVNDDAVHKTD